MWNYSVLMTYRYCLWISLLCHFLLINTDLFDVCFLIVIFLFSVCHILTLLSYIMLILFMSLLAFIYIFWCSFSDWTVKSWHWLCDWVMNQAVVVQRTLTSISLQVSSLLRQFPSIHISSCVIVSAWIVTAHVSVRKSLRYWHWVPS